MKEKTICLDFGKWFYPIQKVRTELFTLILHAGEPQDVVLGIGAAAVDGVAIVKG